MEEATLREVAKWKFGEVRTRLLVAPTYRRAFQAYGLGMEKTGTHSVAGLLRRRYRADHEPDYPFVIRRIVRDDGTWSPLPERSLLARDRRLWLEMESCWLNVFNVDSLVTLFPESRFILTVRDCYSWLDSLVNHLERSDIGPHWTRAQQAYYRPQDFEYQAGERAFEQVGLYPLRAYLSAWRWHNQKVLDVVPPGRLLVVPTHRIASSSDTIAEFLGIPADTLDPARGHEYSGARKFGILEKLDPSLLQDTVEELCGDLMARWFPAALEAGAPGRSEHRREVEHATH